MSRFKRMNAQIKKMWVDALRSGKFKQGHGTLYNSYRNEYCCLGVLQTLVEPENKYGRRDRTGWHLNFPTASCLKTAGLGRHRFGDETGICVKLADMNDASEKSFKEIADFIEQNL